MMVKSRRALPVTVLLFTLACSSAGERNATPAREISNRTAGAPAQRPEAAVSPMVFNEIWGYLMKGEERELAGGEPLTDICYFGVPITPRGELGAVPAPPQLPGALRSRVRVHIVITELSNPALTHFCLNPALPYRKRLVGDIVRAAARFDGVQIDFESVPAGDAKNFHGFLDEIRKGLPAGKPLSVAVPARRKSVNDAYDYAAVSKIADHVIIMAYDQHWSTSRPGPVGSVVWLKEIIDFTEHRIPRRKLVIGLPLYGRAWQDRTLARALRNRHIDDLIESRKATPSYSPETGCYFEYDERVTVRVFYDDIESTRRKLELCRDKNIDAAAFWRMGQGSSGLWPHIRTAPAHPSRVPAQSLNDSEEKS